MRTIVVAAVAATLLAAEACASARDVGVPKACTTTVNEQLSGLVAGRQAGPVDNVMVCGTTIGASQPQPGGPHGGHEILSLRVPLAGTRGSALVEVVTNDNLDGRVTAPRGVVVFAYGQYFLLSRSQDPFVAGIHDTHCATHRGADNGWVVVNGTQFPQHRCHL